jgi:hypothetical protein
MRMLRIDAAIAVCGRCSSDGACRSRTSAVGLLLLCAGCAREAASLAAAPWANLAQPLPNGAGWSGPPGHVGATRE